MRPRMQRRRRVQIARERIQRKRNNKRRTEKRQAGWLQQIASGIANFTNGALGGGSAYDATDTTQKALEGLRPVWGTSDQTLVGVLGKMVAQGRHACRNVPIAKAVCWAYRADLIGKGIRIEPISDDPDDPDVALLRREFHRWAECAGINNESLWDMQWTAAGELPAAGAALWRVTIDEHLAARGEIPVRIMPLEVEWLSDQPAGDLADDHKFVLGVEYDAKGRRVAFHISHPEHRFGLPGTSASAKVERVPDLRFGNGEGIIHAFSPSRVTQSHGEPIIAAVIERLYQANDLVRLELGSARVASNLSVIFETGDNLAYGDEDETDGAGTSGTPVQSMPLNTIFRADPGETAKIVQNTRPTQNIGIFLETIIGEIAGATGVSRRWLTRSMEGGNYSRDRMDRLLSKQIMDPVKRCLGYHLATRVYEAVAPWILLRAGRPVPQSFAHEIRPDQPEFIDPVKDTAGLKAQVDSDFATEEEVLAQRGRDRAIVRKKRQQEKLESDDQAVARIVALADRVAAANAANPDLKLHWSHVAGISGAANAPSAFIGAVAPDESATGESE